MQVKRKFDVFISSFCREKYTYVRKALKKMIEDTGLANAYVFENEPGSSKDVKSAYLDEVARCDVFILLVDNSEPIYGATLSEYNLAKKLNKKILCFFCDENTKEITETQREIEKTEDIKYELVHCFSDMSTVVFDTLLQDLVSNYRTSQMPDIKQNITPELTNKTIISSANLSKETLFVYNLSENPIADKLFGKNQHNQNRPSHLTELLNYYFRVALLEKSFDVEKFNELKKLILERHEEPFKSLVGIRLEALKHYYNDDLDACIASLQKAVAYIQEKQPMAQWLLNDVAIDLRNAIILNNNKKGKFEIKNEGQNIIDASTEHVIFPELDRISSNIAENAIKNYKKIELLSPYTTSLNSYHDMFEDISSYFCIAILYGSITHIRLVPLKCAELLLPLCLEIHDISFYAEYIKNILVCNEQKDLDESLRVANINTSLIPFINVDNLLSNIQNMPISDERHKARINVLKHFGYYYSEDRFSTEETWFFSYITLQDTNKVFGNINNLAYETIKHCIHRFSQDRIVEYCIYCIQSKNEILMQNCVSLTYNIDFSRVATELQKKFKLILIDNITKKVLWNAIIQFGYKCSIDWADLKDAVKQKTPQFYAGLFSLEFVFTEKDDLYKQILSRVLSIKHRNASQGNSGIIGYTNDLFGTIWNIIKITKLQLTWDEIVPVLSACEETILTEKQLPGTKIKAMTLILNLKKYYSLFSDWTVWGENIFQNQECVMNASYVGFFDKTSSYSVRFAFELFKLFFNKENEFWVQFLNLSIEDSYDIIACLKFLCEISIDFENDLSNEVTFSILQMAITLSNHKEVDVRFYAVKLLILLTDTKYSQQALRRLSQCFDNGNSEIKATILYRLKEIHGDSSIISYIKQKALVDPNYWIQSIIKVSD